MPRVLALLEEIPAYINFNGPEFQFDEKTFRLQPRRNSDVVQLGDRVGRRTRRMGRTDKS